LGGADDPYELANSRTLIDNAWQVLAPREPVIVRLRFERQSPDRRDSRLNARPTGVCRNGRVERGRQLAAGAGAGHALPVASTAISIRLCRWYRGAPTRGVHAAAAPRLVHGESVLSARLVAQLLGSRHAAMTLER
jgi:hypothetical protein